MTVLSFQDFSRSLFSSLALPEPPSIRVDSDLFGEICLDSLQAFEMLIHIEALADLTEPPEKLPMIFTLGDAYEYYLLAVELAANEPR